MSISVVIPVKPAAAGKSRLAEVLTIEQRRRLNIFLFRRTLQLACGVFTAPRVIVVSRDAGLLAIAAKAGAQTLAEHGEGLNPALRQAAEFLQLTGGLLALSADLPELTADDLESLRASAGAVAIAPDQAGQGTNALLTNPAGCIPYRFGEDSFARHRAAAAHKNITPVIVSRPGLARDLDTPEDLQRYPALVFQ
jgi:2-phospho-L-lactate guanylyltransferase